MVLGDEVGFAVGDAVGSFIEMYIDSVCEGIYDLSFLLQTFCKLPTSF